jgi:L-lactate dehydrogenase complex protein LldG
MESAREEILKQIRTGLKRKKAEVAPPVLLRSQTTSEDERIESMLARVAALAGKTHRAASNDDAREYVRTALDGRSAVASNAPFLVECGITGLPGVVTGFTAREELREVCAKAACGITSADYALADTGTLVMLSSREEARMISLLPPAHIAVLPASRILSGLDELLELIPTPSEITSSMVLITGPSRTGDIEQILVRGVHGPGEIHVVVTPDMRR